MERRAVGFVCFLLLVATMQITCGSPASAQRSVRDQLVLELAVVAAHEGALDNPRDTALVWQVLETRASTDRGRLDFLRLHSPKALGIDPCEGGNCAWSVQLLRAPEKSPKGFQEGWWAAARARRWEVVLRWANMLVYGLEPWRPCPKPPFSWGYAGDVVGAYLDRKLVPIGCVGVLNDGFEPAPAEVLAVRKARGTRGRKKMR